MKTRERLASRLGFLMLAAGCAVGLGNVWRFPFIVGQNGGAAFVILYVAFLAILGYPLLVCELAIGRGARTGISRALPSLLVAAHPRDRHLRDKARFWRILAVVIFGGNLVLMMYYTDVCGWLLRYSVDYITGQAPSSGGAESHLTGVLGAKQSALGYASLCICFAAAACALGVQRGIERITKFMMLALLALIGILAVRAVTLPGAEEGLKFYLYPDWSKILANPLKCIYEAMAQAFFTLSLGIGCMTIFGSYMEERRTLASEAIWIISIDTVVAFMSGLIIFPACAAYGVEYSQGPGLIFVAIPEVLAKMSFSCVWGTLFFVFLTLAALTTVVAVFECLIGGLIDETRRSRPFISAVVGAVVLAASLPCILGPSKVLEFEDFIVSKLWLPAGGLMIGAFAVNGFGWTWERFSSAANRGEGIKLGAISHVVMKYMLPAVVMLILLPGLIEAVLRIIED